MSHRRLPLDINLSPEGYVIEIGCRSHCTELWSAPLDNGALIGQALRMAVNHLPPPIPTKKEMIAKPIRCPLHPDREPMTYDITTERWFCLATDCPVQIVYQEWT